MEIIQDNNRKTNIRRFLAFSALFLTVRCLSAQEQPDLSQEAAKLQAAAQDAEAKMEVRYQAVHVWALGVNPPKKKEQGSNLQYIHSVENLNKPEFFRLYEGPKEHRVEQKIDKVFTAEEIPVQLGVLLEADEFMDSSKDYFLNYLKGILKRQLRPQDSYFLTAFNEDIIPLKDSQAPYADINDLFKAKNIRWKDHESARFCDAVADAIQKLSPPEDPTHPAVIKKILLIISSTRADADPSAISADELEEMALKSNVQIISLALENSVTDDREGWIGSKLADSTGGIPFKLYKDYLGFEQSMAAIGAMGLYMDRKNHENQALTELFFSIKKEIMIGYYPSEENKTLTGWLPVTIELNDTLPEIKKFAKKGGFEKIQLEYPSVRFIPPATPPSAP